MDVREKPGTSEIVVPCGQTVLISLPGNPTPIRITAGGVDAVGGWDPLAPGPEPSGLVHLLGAGQVLDLTPAGRAAGIDLAKVQQLGSVDDPVTVVEGLRADLDAVGTNDTAIVLLLPKERG